VKSLDAHKDMQYLFFRGLPVQMPLPGAYVGPASFGEDNEARLWPQHRGHVSQ